MASVLTMEDLSSVLRDLSPGLNVAVAERVLRTIPVVIVAFGTGLSLGMERSVVIGSFDLYEEEK